ncbi:YbjQ family protein [Candidatus Uhrbacteria bacterium]|jgi:uncharacterized protein YbjQ (UPF0145 family)|nr:YbjQ family protein [Candidatus Uhrbacteria bacterium]MBT7717373.1 YbjQ family protein [Candidatus Uhrbacteria bacterium]
MIITTTDTLSQGVSETIGLVQGSTTQSRHVGHDIVSGLKTIIGGELHAYTELLESARAEAMNRMIAQAQEKGATAIIGVRFTTSSIAKGASEILAYGTAVKI